MDCKEIILIQIGKFAFFSKLTKIAQFQDSLKWYSLRRNIIEVPVGSEFPKIFDVLDYRSYSGILCGCNFPSSIPHFSSFLPNLLPTKIKEECQQGWWCRRRCTKQGKNATVNTRSRILGSMTFMKDTVVSVISIAARSTLGAQGQKTSGDD